MSFSRIAVLGLGRVGTLAARLLHAAGFEVAGIDAHPPSAPSPYRVLTTDLATADLADLFAPYEAVLSCLPYVLNKRIAETAHKLSLHYFDLTEDVATTQAIRELGKTAKAVLAPQCGLAPGFVAIVGANLASQFDQARSIRMRVGALPRHPTGLLGYAFNWSPEGVVNEYLNDCEVIEDGQHKWVSPVEWIETVYVNGVQLEAFTTSGGLGTMCESYLGKVQNLDYKTLRYPGHAKLMNFFFHELLMRERRALAGEILTYAKPPVDDDVVYLHVSAEGSKDGKLQRQEHVRSYYPRDIAGQRWTAIAWTTAVSACAVIEMVRDGKLPARGFVKQEQIPLDVFLQTQNGAYYADTQRNRPS